MRFLAASLVTLTQALSAVWNPGSNTAEPVMALPSPCDTTNAWWSMSNMLSQVKSNSIGRCMWYRSCCAVQNVLHCHLQEVFSALKTMRQSLLFLKRFSLCSLKRPCIALTASSVTASCLTPVVTSAHDCLDHSAYSIEHAFTHACVHMYGCVHMHSCPESCTFAGAQTH